MDATFKVAPKNFYQLFNVLVYLEEEKICIPFVFVLMTSKSFLAYKKIFQDIKLLLIQNKIEWNYKKIRITCDFEKSLLNAIKEEFNSSIIQGCYFHYLKSLWKKCKKLGLTKSKLIKNTKKLVFAFKIYPLILEDNKSSFIESLYEFGNSLGGEYKNYIKYLKKLGRI